MSALDELKTRVTKLAGDRDRLSGQKDSLEGQITTIEEQLKTEFGCNSLEEAKEKQKQLDDQIQKQIIDITKLVDEADSILKGKQ
jgi:TolA-binding protein